MVVFMSYRRGVEGNLYRKQVNVAGEEELLYRDGLRNIPTSWSPDGKFILFGIFGGDGDISALPLTPERAGAALKPIPFLRTPFKKGFAQFSPDGRWVAYDSDESKRREIYVAQFPGAGGRRRISIAGGTHPRWRSDGKEIFYVAPDRRLMAAQVTVKGNTLEAGEVRPLFGPVIAERGYLYDVSADGRRFLVALEPKQQTSEPLTLMENWTALLKK